MRRVGCYLVPGMLVGAGEDYWASFGAVMGELTKIWRVDNVESLTIESTKPPQVVRMFSRRRDEQRAEKEIR